MSPERIAGDEWLAGVRAAKAGPELLGWILRRVKHPYDEGPFLDDRDSEGSEQVFERLAAEDENFRARLDETARHYFADDVSNPARPETIPVTRAMFDLVQRRALSGAYPTIRAWFAQHDSVLRADSGGYLARAALGALAMSQLPGVADTRDFWLNLWKNGPPVWQPRAFIGLRLQNPIAAAQEIPELMRRAEAARQDPGALLHGLWNQQPGGRAALLQWLRGHEEEPMAEAARGALRKRVDDPELLLVATPIGMNRRKTKAPPLCSLAAVEARDWYT